ncbi:major facilitator superfamily transporter [Citrobacter braakii]|nr:major facilitator superfamily transporter [Citrobacter braakii]
MNDYKMTPGELRATWGLGTVFSLRMLGMFMVSAGSDHVRYGATGGQ